MLHRARSSQALLCLTGMVLLLSGLFWVVRASLAQVDAGEVVHDHRPMLLGDTRVRVDSSFLGYPLFANPKCRGWFVGFLLPGPLLYTSLGPFVRTLSTLRPRLVHWSVQVVLWLGRMSCWAGLALAFNRHEMSIPDTYAPFFWITLACSLVLLALFQPVLARLKQRCLPPTLHPPERDGPTRSEAASLLRREIARLSPFAWWRAGRMGMLEAHEAERSQTLLVNAPFSSRSHVQADWWSRS